MKFVGDIQMSDEEFRRVASTLSSLHHENILRYFGSSVTPEGFSFYVTEKCTNFKDYELQPLQHLLGQPWFKPGANEKLLLAYTSALVCAKM